MNRTEALARIREHYIDDDNSTDRWDDEALTRWLDVARARVWARYCSHGGSAFEEIHAGTTASLTGLLALPGRRRVRRLRMADGNCFYDIQRVNRMAATAYVSANVEVLCTREPGTPTTGTDAVWPDPDDTTEDQPGLNIQLEELLLSMTAEYALVKDHSPYEAIVRNNKQAWDEVKMDIDLDSSGATSINSTSFRDNYGWDVDTENGGIVLFKHNGN